MNDMKIFENSGFGAVRVVDVNGEPWGVAKDVLRALDYADDYNPSRAMQAIPGEWKGVHRMHTPGGGQEMLIISEQGLYFFLGRSDKPKALPYQMWVAGDVCECLELGNPRTSVALLDDDEKGVHTMDTPNDAVNTHCKKSQ